MRCIADQSIAASVSYDVPVGDDFAVIFRFQEILEHLEWHMPVKIIFLNKQIAMSIGRKLLSQCKHTFWRLIIREKLSDTPRKKKNNLYLDIGFVLSTPVHTRKVSKINLSYHHQTWFNFIGGVTVNNTDVSQTSHVGIHFHHYQQSLTHLSALASWGLLLHSSLS